MFGTNPIRKRETRTDALQVTSIWHTIQGEGPLGGMPATFVRLSGCTLACFFCDTSWNEQAPYTPAGEVAEQILAVTPPTTRVIVVTGGEPLRQAVGTLYEEISDRWMGEWRLGKRPYLYPIVQIETSGSIWDPTLERVSHRIVSDVSVGGGITGGILFVCSPKTPTLNPSVVHHTRHYKYVIRAGETAPEDGLPTKSTQKRGHPAPIYRPLVIRAEGRPAEWDRSNVHIWVSPCDEYNEEANKTNREAVRDIAMQFGYRVSLQAHKLIGAE